MGKKPGKAGSSRPSPGAGRAPGPQPAQNRKPKRKATWPYVLVMLSAWGVIFGGLLVHPRTVFRTVFGDNHGQIAGGKEESLITEHARNPGQGHRTAVPAKFRKCLSFCNAIGVPCHIFVLPKHAEGSNRPIRKLVMLLKPLRS